ncbi:MAG: hypothetical protein QT05_C0005G0003 [archaeon GW2011_AR13]|nr:MAG: hypothetical protein QT05_C0005G0003 [archaeon GW2011_AR13]HIG94489.1 hypothetical protein [Nanoarchaeota archaeon]HIH62999.1 hypothetical protein [Nanoarchaeota archaeon]HIJ10264.1 hypothetical protein [Nanoarchaeota archaeon]
MVKQDILGGLFSAVSRGIDLKNAMQSLYNAGYEKEEIEEAAIIIQKGQFTQDPITQKIIPIVEKLVEEKKEEPKKEPIQEIIPIVEKQKIPIKNKPATKKVSDYDHIVENNDRKIIAVLVIILIFLVGVLLATIIFKPEIISFINEFLNKNA